MSQTEPKLKMFPISLNHISYFQFNNVRSSSLSSANYLPAYSRRIGALYKNATTCFKRFLIALHHGHNTPPTYLVFRAILFESQQIYNYSQEFQFEARFNWYVSIFEKNKLWFSTAMQRFFQETFHFTNGPFHHAI